MEPVTRSQNMWWQAGNISSKSWFPGRTVIDLRGWFTKRARACMTTGCPSRAALSLDAAICSVT